MIARQAFSLIEVLFSAALLGVVVAACVPMLATRKTPSTLTPDPDLKRFVHQSDGMPAPPGVDRTRFTSSAGENVEGEWIITLGPNGCAVAWYPIDSDAGQGVNRP